MKRLILAVSLALAGCQFDQPTIGGTVVSVVEAERGEDLGYLEESAKHYEDPLVPEVPWKVEIRLDDGSAVTVTQTGPRRHEPGERVRLLRDPEGALLL